MARNYQPKGGAGGRPPIDDKPLARGVLFATHVEGRGSDEVYRIATEMLMQARAADVKRAAVAGRRKARLGCDSARRRVKEVVAKELKQQGNTPLTGLPSNLRQAGHLLAAIARRDGYNVARATLVSTIAYGLGWGGVVEDPDFVSDCYLAAEQWVAEIEASLPG